MYNLELPMITWAGWQNGPRRTFSILHYTLGAIVGGLAGAAWVITLIATAQ